VFSTYFTYHLVTVRLILDTNLLCIDDLQG